MEKQTKHAQAKNTEESRKRKATPDKIAKLDTAYRYTYGKGIDPEAVPDMLAALETVKMILLPVNAAHIIKEAIKKATKEVE